MSAKRPSLDRCGRRCSCGATIHRARLGGVIYWLASERRHDAVYCHLTEALEVEMHSPIGGA